jgi:DNA-binding Lrp family transcriptional regulator
MVHALIMVETGTAKSTEILDGVTALEGVSEAHVVAGEYDVIAEFDGEEMYDVLETASSRIQGIDGVVDTRTYVSIDE